MQVSKEICPRSPCEMREQEVFTTLEARRGIREDFLQKERLDLGEHPPGEQGGKGHPWQREYKTRRHHWTGSMKTTSDYKWQDPGRELRERSIEKAAGAGCTSLMGSLLHPRTIADPGRI